MILALSCLISWASAADVTILQVKQTFLRATAAAASPETPGEVVKDLKIKVGDSLTFKNLDRVAHNVYGVGFDLLSQAPGSVTTQKFDKAGKQTIRCAIHPKMKFELEVEP